MLYERYERRIRRNFLVLQIIQTYRILITTIVAIALFSASGFSLSKGMIYDVSIPSSFEYSADIEFSSKALFSTVSYRYREVGETTWTEEQPTTVGDYQVEIVTNQVFGRQNTKILPFTIEPKPLTLRLADTTIPFGDMPVLDVSLSEGDYIDEVTFIYQDLSVSETTVTIDSITIKDSAGLDVTSSYDFDTTSFPIQFAPREITVELLDASKIYDGAVLTSDQFEIVQGTMMEGSTIEITASGSQLDVGVSFNSILTTSIVNNDIDVTNNYDITYVDGTLAVTTRALTIETASDTKTYDGTPLSNNGYTITDGSLAPGDTIQITDNSTQTYIGTTDNVLTIQITDSNGRDVTSNYDITPIYGTLDVTTKSITIKTSDDTKVYDGTILSNTSYTFVDSTLADGDVLIVLSSTEILNVGVFDNEFSIQVEDANGLDVTSNYDVTYILGSLEITARPLTIETGSTVQVYDALQLADHSYTITDGTLVSGDTIDIVASSVITNVGSTDNVFTLDILDNEATNVTSNYDITFVLGSIEITPREITIQPTDESKVYDGEAITSSTPQITSGTLATGQTITITTSGSQLGVGISSSEITSTTIEENGVDVTSNYTITTNTGSLEITARNLTIETGSSSKVYDGTALTDTSYTITEGTIATGDTLQITNSTDSTTVSVVNNVFTIQIVNGDLADVSGNYDVTFVEGTLEITQRPITIQPTDETKMYDGTSLTSVTPSVISGTLVSGHTIEITTTGSQLTVGTSINSILTATIYDNGNDVSSNYVITFEDGSLQVTVRPITIETNSDSKVYDGSPLSNQNYSITSGTLVFGDTISVTDFTSITDVGSITNTLTLVIQEAGVVDVTSNYDITYVNGTLDITPQPLTIQTNDGTKGYDRTPLFNDGYTITSGSLITGDTINVTSHTEITTVGSVDNILTIEIFDGDTIDVTSNYAITYVYGTLEITPRALTIETNSDTSVYDGTPLSNAGYTITDGVLATNDVMIVTTITERTNVGTSDNILVIRIDDSEGVDVTSNYDITYVYGQLEITPRAITITSNSDSQVYDGTALSNQNYSITTGDLAGGDTINITDSTERVDVGSEHNILTLEINNLALEDVTSNYSITYVYGTLEITPRPITIQTSTDTKVYDGLELQNENYTITNGSLAPNDSLIVTSSTAITDVSTVNNVFTVSIENIASTDVTLNYSITYVYGTLDITKRPITIQPTDHTKVYDGTPLTTTDVTIVTGSLVSGHTIDITTSGSQTDVGSSLNSILSTTILYGGINVTSNYDITVQDGTLDITPRPITIQPTDAIKVYDGTSLTTTDVTISSGTLVGGHTIDITTSGSQTNVGTSDNSILSTTILDGVTDVTSNYEITLVSGTLEVTPRPITIDTFSDSKVYDGTPLSNQNYTITSGTLVAGDSITITDFTSITSVGVVDNSLTVIIETGAAVDVTSNYEITFVEGTLEITPRPLTIETNSDSKVYDGSSLSNQNYTITSGTLVAGDAITITDFTSISTVDLVDNVLTMIIETGGAVDVTSNYDITFFHGTLEITPRPITIETNSASKVYDGSSLSNQNYSVTAGTLVAGDTLNISNYTEITDVDLVNNQLQFIILDALALDVTSNYDITFVEGTLEITQRAITITNASDSKVYDGTPLTNENYTISVGSLAVTDTLNIIDSTSITSVGVIDNILTIEIVNSSVIDVTSNYDITYVNGTLEITPRPITIETASDSKVYDGTPLSSEAFTITAGSLAIGDTISITDSSTITNVGTVSNAFTIDIQNSSVESVLLNYTITYTEGTLEVTPRPITIQTNNDTKEYDGTALSNQGFTITSGSLVAGETINVVTSTELTIVDVVDNVFTVEIVDGIATDLTANYLITYDLGFLEITPRTIVISTASDSKLYDGTPLTNSTWELTDGTILNTHQLTINVTGTITEVGLAWNTFTYQILDSNLDDVSMYYTVVENLGVLEIERVKTLIVIQSASDSKIYDGTALTNSNWDIYDGALQPGHTLDITMTGTITNVGVTDNTFTYVVRDAENNDVTATYYDVEVSYGQLTVLDADQNGTNFESGTTISDSGTLGDSPPLTVLQIYSDADEVIYLRDKSYGDYNKSGWDAPTVYESPYGVTPFLFPSSAIDGSITSYQVQVKALLSGMSYYLPYYATNGFYGSTNDVYVNHTYDSVYTVDYVSSASVDYTSLTILDPTYQAYEAAYRDFVYNTYLQLPRETKDALLQIASENGLSASSSTVIQDVQSYIQNAAVYNLAYDPIPDNVDIAIYFLEVSREGICQHFATAGVAMYRALGIPARYVTGFYAPATASEWVDVATDQAHAWVEIYIDGFGWIPIEVTAGGFGEGAGPGSGTGSGGSGGTDPVVPDENLIPLDIYSGNDSKVYDGSPLTNGFFYSIGTLLPGHVLTVDVVGTITQVGEVDNLFTYIIEDGNGVDVTNLYDITPIYGKLVVVPANDLEIIEFQVFDITTTYDGETATHSSTDYWIPSQNLPAGYTVTLDIVGSIDGIGKVITGIDESSIVILDENQIDVTNQYNIITYGGSITVLKRNITITSFSATKDYDGTPLTSDVYYISQGVLATGDILTVTITGTITEPGSTPNTIGSILIENANGVDVTSYYSVNTVTGTLTVDAVGQ